MDKQSSYQDPFSEESQLNMDLTLDKVAFEYLRETAKWGKFLAIVGFVLIGFMVIAAFFMEK